MDNFFKQFKRNLENRPEPVYEGRLWDRLEKDMDEREKKPRGGLFWWLAIPGVLLLGMNVFLFAKLNNTNQRMSSLELQRDTVVQTKVIYKTDTIYKTIIQKEKTIRYASNTDSKNTVPNFRFPAYEFDIVHPIALDKQFSGISSSAYADTREHPFLNPYSKLQLGVVNDAPHHLLLQKAVNILPGSEIGLLDIPIPRIDSEVEIVEKKFKKTLRYHVARLQPRGFAVGLNGGWALPVNQGLFNKNGYQIGLTGSVDFSSDLRMWIDASYLNIRFETGRMDEAIGVPVIQPPTDEFVFEAAEAPQPSIQYSVGMQYLFNSKNKWKPFVGIGYGAVSLLPYEVTYDFENPNTNFEWIFEEQVNNRELITDFLFLQLGLDCEINKSWFWQFKTGYRTNLESKGFKSPRLMSIQAGINYRIK